MLVALALAVGLPAGVPSALAQGGDAALLEGREALRKKDRTRLAAAKAASAGVNHPLAMWPDYWELTARIGEAQQAELSQFSARWAGTYVDDRLRNDWLLELGKRRDWANFTAEFPRFRLNDDREVTCYALITDHLAGKDVRDAALAAWLAQRDTDDGCGLMAATLVDARRFTAADVWRKTRVAMDGGRPRVARQAAAVVSIAAASAVGDIADSPARFLAQRGAAEARSSAELTTLALMRLASNDPAQAANALVERWDRELPADLASWAWASVGKQAALKLQAEAPDYFERAALRGAKAAAPDVELPDEILAWKVRAALRADNGKPRWQQVVQAVNAMPVAEQRDAAWVYWKARGLAAIATNSQDAESMRALARELMASIAGQMNFYAALAADQLDQPMFMPARPDPLSTVERDAAMRNPGLARALQLISLGLRNEGVREWNYTLRGMSDRELLAAAQLACDREIWDRCINTSERTKTEIDLDQRFPMPFRKELTARAGEIGLDAAYVYGLIRQESRFIVDARSSVGASGLMQVMPATARWTAKKIGIPYTSDLIADRDTNLRIGTAYLKFVLDDFQGSQALAAAAYNAGPSRSRKWREGPLLETAIWAENVPFNETRDYVKKVLSNASYYAAQLRNTGPGAGAALELPGLKARLGRGVAPADPALAQNKDLP